MNIGVGINSNLSMDKINLVTMLFDDIQQELKVKNYGSSLKSVSIGFICVSEQFDFFFKSKKAKWSKGKKVVSPDGIPFIFEDDLEIPMKIDFITFQNGTEKQCFKLLANGILNSLDEVDFMKKKPIDFNLDKFKRDIKDFLMHKNYF